MHAHREKNAVLSILHLWNRPRNHSSGVEASSCHGNQSLGKHSAPARWQTQLSTMAAPNWWKFTSHVVKTEAVGALMSCCRVPPSRLINSFIQYSVQISRHTRVESSSSRWEDHLAQPSSDFWRPSPCETAVRLSTWDVTEESQLQMSHSETHSPTQEGSYPRTPRFVVLRIKLQTFTWPVEHIRVFDHILIHL